MAELVIKSRKLTREQLASVFPNHRLVKAFEDILDDLTSAIPDSVQGLFDSVDSIEKAPNLALIAITDAAIALAAAKDALAETLSGQLSAIREDLIVLRKQIDDLQRGICS